MSRPDENPTFRVRGQWPEGLGDVMHRTPRAAKLLQESAVRCVWNRVVPSPVIDHCRVVALKGSNLVVSADDEAWAHQLRWLADSILTRLREEIPRLKVTRMTVTKPGSPTGSVIG